MKEDLKPTRKVTSAGLAMAVTVILVWVLNVVPPHIEVPVEVASSITALIGVIFGYMTRPSKPED
jgi:uncharacterized membrane protein